MILHFPASLPIAFRQEEKLLIFRCKLYFRILKNKFTLKSRNVPGEVMDNPDVLEQIFCYLDPASVKTASLVSRLISHL